MLREWIVLTCKICNGSGYTRNPASGYNNHCITCDGKRNVRIKVSDLKEYKK